MINSPNPLLIHQPPITIYIAETTDTNVDPSPKTKTTDLAIPTDFSSHSTENVTANSSTPYSIIPCSDAAQKDDEHLLKVCKWHNTLERPSEMTDSQFDTFLHYCTEFFISADRLWRKDF
jgi:hypothetical protein